MKLSGFLIVVLFSLNAFSWGDFDRVITCEIEDHPVYSQTVVYGDSEIHFLRKDGKETSVHHDGFLFSENADVLTAYYHDGDDLLFFMSKNFNYGLVQVPGFDEDFGLDIDSDLYQIYSCDVVTKN